MKDKLKLLIVGGGYAGIHAAEHADLEKYDIILFDASPRGVGGDTSSGHPGMCSRFSADRISLEKINSPVEAGGCLSNDIISGTEPGETWVKNIPAYEDAWTGLLKTRVGLAAMGMKYQLEQLTQGHRALNESGFQFNEQGASRYYFDLNTAQADVELYNRIGVPVAIKESDAFPGVIASITFPGGIINPQQYCVTQAKVLREKGVVIYERTKVDEIVIENNQFKGVRVCDKFYPGDAVIISTCANRDIIRPLNPAIADAIAPFTGVSINVPITDEQASRLQPVFQIWCPNSIPGTNFLVNVGIHGSAGNKEMRVGGGFLAGVLQTGKRFGIAADALKKWVAKLLPDYVGDFPEWHGIRSMPANAIPIIGEDPKIKRVFYKLGEGSSATSLSRGDAIILSEILDRTMAGREIQSLHYSDVNLKLLLAGNIGRSRA